MGKCDDLIVKYVKDLEEKCGMKLDMKFLIVVIIVCGFLIYCNDVLIVLVMQKGEFEIVKKSFFIKKLGFKDILKLDEGLSVVMDMYGCLVCKKYCVVVYYLLVKYFCKVSLFK